MKELAMQSLLRPTLTLVQNGADLRVKKEAADGQTGLYLT